MKALVTFLTMTLSFSAAFADGTIYCTAIDQDNGQRQDVLLLEPEDMYLLTVAKADQYLTSRKETNDEWIFGNSKYLVTLNHPNKTLTQQEKASGASKVYTEVKCRYNGEPDEGW